VFVSKGKEGVNIMTNGAIHVQQITPNIRLKELRESNEYSQEQLARQFQMEHEHLKKVEDGCKPFTPNLVDQICEFFSCSKEYLFGASDMLLPE
jgi:transcriptional regulator with XRE-family HTH domain